MTTRSAFERLAAQNPVPPGVHPPGRIDDDTLDDILRTPRTPQDPSLDAATRRRGPVLVAAAAAVALVVGIGGAAGVLRTPPGTDGAIPAAPVFALPPASGESFTLTSADGAARQAPPLNFVSFDEPVTTPEVVGALADLAASVPPQQDGPFEYIRLRSWGLYTAQTTEGTVFDYGISDITREDWRAEDGSGLMITTEDGRSDTVTVPEQPFNPGAAIPDATTVAEVRDALLQSRGGSVTTARWVDEYAQAWAGQVLTPQQNAAYLEILQDEPDLDVVGETTDRVGRRGIALSASTPDVRIVLIVDPGTGALLDTERIALTTNAVEVPIALPATISYTVFEDRGRTATVGQRP
ncbi:hypothetical protein HQ325_16640 [Rhodococcus sp. BP-349]|uniref:hypothetical protein n=1 Tax=unclassified Rhodococcus (in: high G+C Gram-positive bacteria) TaxID=192944 RepID=UPI001C9B7F6B|nr:MULTISPECIES: hypothetical protein [unclassified Rhodococcus (in: high G+C Gram-positive bacteria)]MBY6540303.1 hypothetical protein [Rhodococcus sp. BP-363]MBY6545672.1 hypothetical protein [Rhodococcus sp. BP-369]MBY6564902.1 hypothetical protein [Rhodococcus sp. BP-370]MBY6578162.1 hypothetical protein [Rhodococcus sp. BP-364]MBY6587463.1 hypothetical protein [Rhodococcus sp. BP-358]